MPGIAMVDRSSEAPHAMNFVVDQQDANFETGDGRDAIQWEGKRTRAQCPVQTHVRGLRLSSDPGT